MFNTKGQGTIEYLVIIAIVVVIALVVVGLLFQLMGQGSGVPEAGAQAAWKSSQPWAITAWDHNGTHTFLILQNNSAEALDLVDVYLTAADHNAVGSSNVASSGKVTVIIDSTDCTAGSRYSFPKENIHIDYNTSAFPGKRQNANADIIGNC